MFGYSSALLLLLTFALPTIAGMFAVEYLVHRVFERKREVTINRAGESNHILPRSRIVP